MAEKRSSISWRKLRLPRQRTLHYALVWRHASLLQLRCSLSWVPYRTRRRHSTRTVHCSRPSALWGNTWRIERGWIIGWSIVWTKASYVTNDSEIVSQISYQLGCWGWRAALLNCVRSYIFWKLYHYRQVRLISARVSSFHIISLFIIVIVDIQVFLVSQLSLIWKVMHIKKSIFSIGVGERGSWSWREEMCRCSDNFTILIIITVSYAWVNNRVICKVSIHLISG